LTNSNVLYAGIRKSFEQQSGRISRLEKENRFYRYGFYVAAGTALSAIGVIVIQAAVD
jgi:hypothetical protein